MRADSICLNTAAREALAMQQMRTAVRLLLTLCRTDPSVMLYTLRSECVRAGFTVSQFDRLLEKFRSELRANAQDK